MNKKIEAQVYKILYQVLGDAKNEIDTEITLKALLTENELAAIAKG